MSKITVMTPEENDSGKSKPTFFSTPKSEHAKSECCGCSCVGWSSSKKRYKDIRKNSEGVKPAKKQLFFDNGKPEDLELKIKSTTGNLANDNLKIISGFHDDEENECENSYDDYSVSSYTGSFDAVDDCIQFYFECKEKERMKADGVKMHENPETTNLNDTQYNLKLEMGLNAADLRKINTDIYNHLNKEVCEFNHEENDYNNEIMYKDEDMGDEEYEESSYVESNDEELGGSVECNCRDCMEPSNRINSILLPCPVPNNSPVHSSCVSINNHHPFKDKPRNYNNFDNDQFKLEDKFYDDFYSIYSSQPNQKMHYVTPSSKINYRKNNKKSNKNKIKEASMSSNRIYNRANCYRISNIPPQDLPYQSSSKHFHTNHRLYKDTIPQHTQHNTYNYDYSPRDRAEKSHTNKEITNYTVIRGSINLTSKHFKGSSQKKRNLISDIKDLNLNKGAYVDTRDRRAYDVDGCEDAVIHHCVDNDRHNNTLDSHYKKHTTYKQCNTGNVDYKSHGGDIEGDLELSGDILSERNKHYVRGTRNRYQSFHKQNKNQSKCRTHRSKQDQKFHNHIENTHDNNVPVPSNNANNYVIKSKERSRRNVRKRLCRISRYIRKGHRKRSGHHHGSGSSNSSSNKSNGSKNDVNEPNTKVKTRQNNLNSINSHYHDNIHNNINTISTDSSPGSFVVTTLAQI